MRLERGCSSEMRRARARISSTTNRGPGRPETLSSGQEQPVRSWPTATAEPGPFGAKFGSGAREAGTDPEETLALKKGTTAASSTADVGRIVSFIIKASSVRRFLEHIGEPSVPPRIALAGGSPEWYEDSADGVFSSDAGVSLQLAVGGPLDLRLPGSLRRFLGGLVGIDQLYPRGTSCFFLSQSSLQCHPPTRGSAFRPATGWARGPFRGLTGRGRAVVPSFREVGFPICGRTRLASSGVLA